MLYEDYKTPAQTSIFIEDIWVDDAYFVSYEIQNPRTPVYGYNQAHFGVVGDGHSLVTGQIIINFRYPGYLFTAIREAQKRRNNQQRPGIENGLQEPQVSTQHMRRLLNDLKRGSVEDRINLLVDSWNTNTIDHTSDLLSATFLGGPEINPGERNYSPAMIPADRGGFDLQLFYGHTHGEAIIETVKDCYITGQGKVISGSASGAGGPSSSGTVIYEVYPYFASRVIPQGISIAPTN